MYKYIDRHSQDPRIDRRAEIRDLVRFARAAKLDDVMVFALEENLNTGHITPQQQDEYLDMMEDIRAALEKENVTFSINPWATTLHKDNGATLQPGQDFRLMVDVDGRQARAMICPICDNWRKYIADVYRRYARLKPAYIWLEDDFRFHNHGPLRWGGCFCDEHMRLFSRMAGKPLTREEFIKGVLAPGKPHPYRRIWLDSCRETTLENARVIAGAVKEVSPETKVSLMSSAPNVHCAEARDWHALLAILGGAHRIHLPAYSERRPAEYLNDFNRVSMMVRAMTPEGTEVLPEVENAPWSAYSKSRKFTAFQMFATLAMNVEGATFNLFDMIGTGVQTQDGYQEMMASVKPRLSALNATGAFKGRKRGVCVLYSPSSSYALHTREGREMSELYPSESWWAAVLCSAGVPFAYTEDVEEGGRTVAVSGQVLRNYDGETIRRLFDRNRVLLNGDAVITLVDMGLGEVIGARSAEWLNCDAGECAYESARRSVFGKTESRCTTTGEILRVEYDRPVDVITDMKNAWRESVGAGQALAEGRILIFPFRGEPQRVILSVRAEILRRTIHEMDAELPVVEGCPYLEPYQYDDGEGGYYLYLVNGAMDDYGGFTLLTGDLPGKVEVFDGEDGWRGAECERTEGGLSLKLDVPSMSAALLRCRRG